MFVDDQIVLKYLSGDSEDEIKNHWIFHSIEKGKYLYEAPNAEKQEDINKILLYIKDKLSDFSPLNKNIYSALYPEWNTIIKNMNVLLVVGCPSPYDAMVREYDGNQYIIFDLIRFSDYKDSGYDFELLIKQLITHETSHLCLRKKYPISVTNSYLDQLKYITFDEAFAHLLAFKDNVEEFDFSSIINDHYNKAFIKLKEAMAEKDIQKQKDLLIQSNSGPYWNKFAAISGKLFLASNIKEVQKLYNSGIDSFISSMRL